MRYRELDEVRAPADVPEAGVKAGDRGVVLIEFEKPRPAVEVMFEWVSAALAEVFSLQSRRGRCRS